MDNSNDEINCKENDCNGCYEIDKTCQKLKLKASKDTDKTIKQRMMQIRKYQKQLQRLLNLPKVQQKSLQWYEMRYNMITASDFAQALGDGKFGSAKQLIQKKCEPLSTQDIMASKSNIFFKWGNMFEPVACQIYSKKFDVKIHEFGLLQHPEHSFFGASPDGISELGIMLEIKCPFKRKIDGEIPLQYYYQIQGQLDVCGLNECDYFECEFKQIENEEEFNNQKQKYEYFGMIVEKKDGSFEYDHQCENVNQQDIVKKIYWVLDKYNIKRVIKDDKFVKEKMKALKDIWEKICFYRQNRNAFELNVLQSIDISTEKYYNGTNDGVGNSTGGNNNSNNFENHNIKFDTWAFRD